MKMAKGMLIFLLMVVKTLKIFPLKAMATHLSLELGSKENVFKHSVTCPQSCFAPSSYVSQERQLPF
jgi:hypothetical protein